MVIKFLNNFKKIDFLNLLMVCVPPSIILGNFLINLTTILISIFGIKLFYKNLLSSSKKIIK